MKKALVLILSLMLMLPLAGCGDDTHDFAVKEGGMTYLVLPESKERVELPDYYAERIGEVDAELLKTAEKNVREEAAEYMEADEIRFQVSEYDGELYLCVEHILYVDESEQSDELCGGDHVHKIFKGIITE